MEALQTLVMTLPLALTSGINLYATVLVVGLAVRFGWVSDAPASLYVLGETPILVVAGVLYVVEFIVDKFQFLDNAWDIIHTVIRPLGAITLAVIFTYGEGDPAITVLAALIAGSVSLVAHSGKAGTRAVLNIVSPGENITNVGLSVAEDVAAGGLAFLAVRHPYLAACIALVALAVIILVLPRLLRWGWFSFKAVIARMVAAFQTRRSPDLLPTAHLALLGHQSPALAVQAKAQKVRGAAGRTGYACVLGNRLVFTYTKWLALHRKWEAPLDRVLVVYFRRSWLIDELEVHYRGDKDAPRLVRFVFTRDRSPLAEELGRRLGARDLPVAAAAPAQSGAPVPA
jgi:hypothetical protein